VHRRAGGIMTEAPTGTAEGVVRVLTGDDWERWRDIRLRALRDTPDAFGSTYEREVAFREELWRERLEDPASVSVLALDPGGPVAMGAGFPDAPGLLHVVAMWVAPQARGRRLAHSVLQVIETWAGTRGLGLHLDVNTGNRAARRSYERYGFVGTGETRPLRDGSPQTCERMVLGGRGQAIAAGPG
jgi:GNAT superfamily N-acetyltransferase